MKLFYLPGACSFVPHTALEWIGEPYEAVAISREKLKSAEFLSLNPQGSVPLLVDGNFSLSQNIAILYYLDDLYPEAKLFGSLTPQDKAKAIRWLAFFNADVHKAFTPLFRLPEYAKGNEELTAHIRQNAKETTLNYLAIADDHLSRHLFFGERISVADVYLYIILNWCNIVGIDFSHLPQLTPFFERVATDQGVQSVRQQEGLN